LPLESQEIKKGRYSQPCAEGAAFFSPFHEKIEMGIETIVSSVEGG
jgi:hypothetical protein